MFSQQPERAAAPFVDDTDYQALFDTICQLARNYNKAALLALVSEGECINFELNRTTPIMWLAREGEVKAVYFLLKELSDHFSLQDAVKGFAMAGDKNNVKYCLEMGASLASARAGAARGRQYALMEELAALLPPGQGYNFHELAKWGSAATPERYITSFENKLSVLRGFAYGNHEKEYSELYAQLQKEVRGNTAKTKLLKINMLGILDAFAEANNQKYVSAIIAQLDDELLAIHEMSLVSGYALSHNLAALEGVIQNIKPRPAPGGDPKEAVYWITFYCNAQAGMLFANRGYLRLAKHYMSRCPEASMEFIAQLAESGHRYYARQFLKMQGNITDYVQFIASLARSGEMEFLSEFLCHIGQTPDAIKADIAINILRGLNVTNYFANNATTLSVLARVNIQAYRLQLFTASRSDRFQNYRASFTNAQVPYDSNQHDELFKLAEIKLLSNAARLNLVSKRYNVNLPQARALGHPDALPVLQIRNEFLRDKKIPGEIFNTIISLLLNLPLRDATEIYAAFVKKLYIEINKEAEKAIAKQGFFSITKEVIDTDHQARLTGQGNRYGKV